jgi:hypothetical protein
MKSSSARSVKRMGLSMAVVHIRKFEILHPPLVSGDQAALRMLIHQLTGSLESLAGEVLPVAEHRLSSDNYGCMNSILSVDFLKRAGFLWDFPSSWK